MPGRISPDGIKTNPFQLTAVVVTGASSGIMPAWVHFFSDRMINQDPPEKSRVIGKERIFLFKQTGPCWLRCFLSRSIQPFGPVKNNSFIAPEKDYGMFPGDNAGTGR